MTRNSELARVIAHRGASASAPENSLSAIALAADQGALAVEIDVNASSDAVPYVHHDDHLERCTNGTGLLHEQESSALDTIRLTPFEGFDSDPLPRLKAVIDLVLERGLALNLEIKPPQGRARQTTDAICAVLETEWPDEATLVFSSFDPAALEHAMNRMPEIPRALLVDRIPSDWKQAMARIDAINLHCSVAGFDADHAQALHEAGHRIYCYTANDDDVALRLLDNGADGVFTDWPGRLQARLGLRN